MRVVAYRHWILGLLYTQFNQRSLAFREYQLALNEARQANDLLNVGRLLWHLAELYKLQGKPDQQDKLSMAAVQTFWQLKSKADATPALATVAMAYHSYGYHRSALTLLKQAADSCQRMGDLPNEAITLFYMADVYTQTKQYLFAVACHQASLEILHTSLSLQTCSKAVYFEALNTFRLANLYHMTQHADMAHDMYLQVFRLLKSSGFTEASHLLMLQSGLKGCVKTVCVHGI
ncbi:MAG: hypothetical protein AAFY17_06730 [Cyanobacteria bacterium J06642_11]